MFYNDIEKGDTFGLINSILAQKLFYLEQCAKLIKLSYAMNLIKSS